MREVHQEFLLGLAGVSATLLGTFIVGVFFYIDSDMHRRVASSAAIDTYLRSATRWVFAAYSIPLLVTLVLASMEPLLGAMTFAVLGGILTLMTIDTGRRLLVKGGSGMSRALVVNEWLTSAAVLAAIILPWALGGWIPEAAAFVPSLLLILASGFVSTAALVMTQFDSTKGLNMATTTSAVRAGGSSPAAPEGTETRK
ncbi:hypothetical protein [Pseudoclavibacter endophyticus]|uniref:Uncharacterized protein n=1 Tax=Pseudoclavibacter endophyticus TaxID=1778590 RepID=A0A6H9WHF6_9MICO|nr:hypothetical protein [Pseudoclavibacter endophyticus]KAB1650389.1 hypothetical protein F8O04_09495 [Pseudoclavibacter endophyticus]